MLALTLQEEHKMSLLMANPSTEFYSQATMSCVSSDTDMHSDQLRTIRYPTYIIYYSSAALHSKGRKRCNQITHNRSMIVKLDGCVLQVMASNITRPEQSHQTRKRRHYAIFYGSLQVNALEQWSSSYVRLNKCKSRFRGGERT